jgi:phosphoserine phosphatase
LASQKSVSHMQQVLTIVANSELVLEDSIPDSARRALAAAGARLDDGDGAARWLAPGRAADIPYDALECDKAEKAVRATLDRAPYDLLAQSAAGRRKRLLIADMDSTVVTMETLDELAAFAGVKQEVSAITERSMRGEIDFVQSLVERVAMLKGLTAEALEWTQSRVRLDPGARTLVATMRAHGAYTALVSGGFNFFTERVRQAVGFDYDEANILEIVDGRLTGRVVPPVINRDGKLNALRRLAAERGVPPEDTLAVGDGANDLAMIRGAGLGVAFHGKPALAAASRARIDHGDLSTLLYFQGYAAEEFAC